MVAAQASGGLLMCGGVTHAALDAIEVVLALAGFALKGIDAAMGGLIGKGGFGHFYIACDYMAIAEIIVNISRGNLTGGNGADNGGGTGDAVASGKETVGILQLAGRQSGDGAALDLDVNIVEGISLNALTDSDDNDVCGHTNLRLALSSAGLGSAVGADGANHLRLYPKSGAVAVLINLDALTYAGNLETLKLAVSNGADAVYLGGKNFSARKNAVNFSNEELIEAVEFAHLHGAKVYVTFNILIHDSELYEAFEFAKFLYEIGVDALIIQDLGLVHLLKTHFPDFEIHNSAEI